MRHALVTLALVLAACRGPRPAPSPPADDATTTTGATATARPMPDQAEAAAAGIGLAFVLTERATELDPAAIVAAYARLAPAGPPLVVQARGDRQTLSFTLGDGLAAVGLMAAPVPAGEAEANIRLSLSGVLRPWTLEHRAHHMVTALGSYGATPRQRLRAFHRLVAAVAIAAGAQVRGVYVGGITHEPSFYVEAVEDYEDPLVVWCGVSVARDGDRISLLSIGMSALGLPDVLLTASPNKPGETLLALFDLLGYLAEREAVIPAGETVGRTAAERIPVRYVPSPIAPKVEVMAVDFP